MRLIGIISLGLLLLPLAGPAVAAELYGTVYSGGMRAANLSISVKGGKVATKTDSNGGYRLDLPPGTHTLIIRGQEFTATVSAGGTKHDIRF